ncbi:hypothetical protein RB195_015224 [Necator americanus]|uniref:Phlebovirus glycoprotein G2 fusion domain-containing protein n=1 Tax=Necator americanus TaxID=51031 RepID=A0ABR1E684_NECAM
METVSDNICNARTVSTDADLHALSCRAYQISRDCSAGDHRKGDVRQMNDGTLIIREEEVTLRNVGGVSFVVHLSVINVVDSREILPPHLAILRLRPLRQKPISISS